MKKLLLVTLIAVSSLVVNAQRDTIKYYPFIIDAVINDTNAFPIGLSSDSFVITNRPELDSIYKLFNVNSYTKMWQGGIDSPLCKIYAQRYRIHCNCNEYLLIDTLKKFDSINNYDLYCLSYLIPRGSLDITNEKLKQVAINIYPNPNNGIFNVKSKNALSSIEVYNLTGKLLYSDYNLNRQTSVDIDLSNLQKGIYFARIQDSKQVVTEKIIIQ